MATVDEQKNKQASKNKKRHLLLYGSGAFLLLVVLVAVFAWQVIGPNFSPPPRNVVVVEDPSAIAIRELDQRLTTLEQDFNSPTDAKNTWLPIQSSERWWVVDAERYLAEANERLTGSTDVKSALAALKSAQYTLNSVDIVAIEATKKALDREIQLLSEYENDNAMKAIRKIDYVLNALKHQNLSDDKLAEVVGDTESTTQESPPASLWGQLTEALVHRFKRLIVVEKKSDNDMQGFGQTIVTHSLMLARTAVLGGDAVSYRYAIANAMQALEQSHPMDYAIQRQLQSLSVLDIVSAPPPIGGALNQIRAFMVDMPS